METERLKTDYLWTNSVGPRPSPRSSLLLSGSWEASGGEHRRVLHAGELKSLGRLLFPFWGVCG